jgi:hypothetical protein
MTEAEDQHCISLDVILIPAKEGKIRRSQKYRENPRITASIYYKGLFCFSLDNSISASSNLVEILSTQNGPTSYLDPGALYLVTTLKSLHQILPHGPHPRPLSVKIHRDSEQQAKHLYTSNGNENDLTSIRLEPGREEEREDEAMEDICRDS